MTKEEEILLAAEEEFFTKGYDAASTATIAKAVGVTHAMVNYYFRCKEKLFCKVLDDHIHSIFSSLTPLMSSDEDFVNVIVNTALAVFDKMNENRRLPFLIQDTAKNHPEFLLRYTEIFETSCLPSVRRHSERLAESIAAGKMKDCTMHEIFDTIFTLSCAPYLNLSILTNLARISDKQINSYLASRREEIKRILEARYR